MHVITILYPRGAETTFDMGYYTSSHLPMFVKALGDNCKGWGVADAHGSNYHCVAWAMVEDLDKYRDALAEHGAELMADVKNYTEADPIMFTGTVVASSNS